MIAIFRKEITAFFASPVGYLVMGLFLVLCGLFLWVFHGPFNIPDYGFADLSLFFLLAPWVLLLLIPAVSMKTLAEERKLGTLELLLSKPLSLSALVGGKFLGVLALAVLTVVPTGIYALAVSDLGITEGNLDTGLVWGSYLGLFFLMAVYAAVGLFASSLTDNQIAAFIGGAAACFILYAGFDALATLSGDGAAALAVSGLGLKHHYESIGQGILDSRDIVYFISVTAFFLICTGWRLKGMRR